MARVLVTGGAGFIGSHLVDMLLNLGHEVAVLDAFSTGRWENLTTGWGGKPVEPPLGPGGYFRVWSKVRPLTVQPGSVNWQPDGAIVADFKPEVVFHLAAQIDVRTSMEHPVPDAETNVVGTLRMLQASAAAGVRRFVFVSSAAIFGDQTPDRDMEPHAAWTILPDPISPYGASKAAAELYVDLYGQRGDGMSTCTLVLSNVYGPRQRPGAGAVNIFARALLAGEPVTLYGDGGNVRDYVFVTDAARALAWAGGCLNGNRGLTGGRRLLGTGVGTTDVELLNLVRRETGGEVVERWEPARPGDIRSMVFPGGHGMTSAILADGVAITVQEIRKEMGL